MTEPPSADAVAFLSAAGLPSFLTGLDGQSIIHVNEALLALTGFEPADLVGAHPRSLESPPAEGGLWSELEVALAAEGRASGEMLCACRDGSSYWGLVTLGAIRDQDGRLSWSLGQIVDVSRRRDAEDAMALSQRREALGLLTNGLAHEYNNFLQILIGYVDSLRRRLGDRPEPPIQRALVRATEAVERAAVLTRHLLAYSRRIAPEVRPIDLDSLVATSADALRASVPARIRLTTRTHPGLPAALCNPSQVRLALNHLVANSIEATPGEGSVEIGTFVIEPGESTPLRPGERAVGVTVIDTGQGMTPEMATRAQLPFATSHEAGRGTGLAIVYGLMRRQNGALSIDSAPGQGTTIRLVFPAVP